MDFKKYDVKEAGKILGVSSSHLYGLCKAGKIPYHSFAIGSDRKTRKRFFFTDGDLEKIWQLAGVAEKPQEEKTA